MPITAGTAADCIWVARQAVCLSWERPGKLPDQLGPRFRFCDPHQTGQERLQTASSLALLNVVQQVYDLQ